MAVLFVSHRRPQVTVVARQGGSWASAEYRAAQDVQVSSLDLVFSVDELYSGIALEEPTL
jgi:hypothetical protein